MRNSPVLGNSTLLRRTSVLAAAAVASLALAGCGDSDGNAVAEDPAPETTSAAASTSAPVEPSETPTETTSAPPETESPDTDALITLEAPTDGATVSGAFDVKGTANSPEANVPWRILDASGKRVQQGHFTAEGWMDKLYPYAGTVDVSKLDAGSYTFEVSVDDPSGGEGKPPQKVSATVVVQ